MRIKVDYKTKESKKIMDYSYILKELEKASLFELARLATAIHQELNDPQRIEQIRNSLIVGQNITWFILPQKKQTTFSKSLFQKS